MTVHGPPPPPPATLESLAHSVQALTARVAALEAEQRAGSAMEIEHGQELMELQAQVKVLEEERKWWRRWHLKWGPWFRAWRDGTPLPTPSAAAGTVMEA